jgi:hypothetical protein
MDNNGVVIEKSHVGVTITQSPYDEVMDNNGVVIEKSHMGVTITQSPL